MFKFNDPHDQQEYSRAIFNANANRRVAYRFNIMSRMFRGSLKHHQSGRAFAAELILGCPTIFSRKVKRSENSR